MASNTSSQITIFEEDWEPEVALPTKEFTKESVSVTGRGRGRAKEIVSVESRKPSGRGKWKLPYTGPIVIKFQMEPVRPVPSLSLTPYQKGILVKKKHSMNEIRTIQSICGISVVNPFLQHLEFKRKQQNANTRAYPLPGSDDYKKQLESPLFNEKWNHINSPIQNIDDQTFFWIDDHSKYWFSHRLLQKEKVLFVDTEGNSWDAYTGFMCLIQISTPQQNFIFDCIKIPQLIETNLKTILENPGVLKVFHACGQDVRWFQRDFGIFLFPVLDTQMLPAPVGPEPGKVDSFATLVNKLLGLSISKEEKTLGQLSDYRCRPLHPNLQLYALDDSRLLLHVYLKLKTKEKVDAFKSTKKILMENIYDGTKDVPNPTQNFATLDKLKLWREEKAKSLDVKREKVASDPALLNSSLGTLHIRTEFHGEVSRVIEGQPQIIHGTEFCFRCGEEGCVARSCTNAKLPKSEINRKYYEKYPEKEAKEKERQKNKRRTQRNAIAAASYYNK